MLLETHPATDINPAPYNPRKKLKKGDDRYERIARSLDRFGLVDPLVWNKRSGNLVSGHQRFAILVDKGQFNFELSVVDLNDTDEKALNLTLNNPAVAGEWDGATLAELLGELEGQAPDAYDELDIALLKSSVDDDDARYGAAAPDDDTLISLPSADQGNDGPPEMELMPYEHYDYVVLMFRDSRDYLAAIDHFGLTRQTVPKYVGKTAIGLGRVLDGAKYLNRIKAELGVEPQADELVVDDDEPGT